MFKPQHVFHSPSYLLTFDETKNVLKIIILITTFFEGWLTLITYKLLNQLDDVTDYLFDGDLCSKVRLILIPMSVSCMSRGIPLRSPFHPGHQLRKTKVKNQSKSINNFSNSIIKAEEDI